MNRTLKSSILAALALIGSVLSAPAAAAGSAGQKAGGDPQATQQIAVADADSTAIMQRRVDAFVSLMGAGSGFDQFVAEHMSPEFFAKRGERGAFIFRVLAKRYGGEPAHLESLSLTTDRAVFELSNSHDEWAEYELMVQPGNAQGRIGGFNARIIPRPLGDELANMDEKQIIAELDRFVIAESTADRFSGAVLLARGNEILYGKGVGSASRESDRPNTLDTVFHLASVTKMFTGLAVCRLIEEERLSLDDTMGRFFPDLAPGPTRDQLTVRQLLTHTSGMVSATLVGPHDEAPEPQEAPIRLQAMDYLARPLQAEPGSSYIYSNAGPIVLGAIIEKITGRPYESYVQETIFSVAGMNNATFVPSGAEPLVAEGYSRDGRTGAWHPVEEMPGPGAPAGGAWATARDMLAFSLALGKGELIGNEMRATMTAGQVDIATGERYGYGWMEHTLNGIQVIGHSGRLPGFSAQFSILPKSGYTLVVLSNLDNGAQTVGDRARHMLTRSAE
jgi:CubicO group peptidase (beta-lactamase class C family)